ncbi:Mitochondrial substrate/solute carrier [Dillenia turbinata]|uniref:Mitochondrial substrate/solute carrier n=1 Tax=Dillenia turbinata TaxID=194707 RepID=A0AAN8ZGG6_9MAGN
MNRVRNGDETCGNDAVSEGETKKKENKKRKKVMLGGSGAMNTSKYLCAGAVSAMVSRVGGCAGYVSYRELLLPLERLELEYIVHGKQGNLFDLIKMIAASLSLRGFGKGILINILSTAPFKVINFCVHDTYTKQLHKLSRNKETKNFDRFVAGAAAGMHYCYHPLHTSGYSINIRTKFVVPGGEALIGIVGTFHHVIQTKGFFSLYNGLVPSIISIAPSAAVFDDVYGILKSTYLHSFELGPVRTLLFGAISGACAEAATYPFEVLPSAAISYFVYGFMKIVLKVD